MSHTRERLSANSKREAAAPQDQPFILSPPCTVARVRYTVQGSSVCCTSICRWVIHHILFDNLKKDFPCIAACFRLDTLDRCSLKFGTRNQTGSRKTRRAVEIKLHAITARENIRNSSPWCHTATDMTRKCITCSQMALKSEAKLTKNIIGINI
jgi:hypothetical protein